MRRGCRATASIRNCEISFNHKAGVVMGGSGDLTDNVMWCQPHPTLHTVAVTRKPNHLRIFPC